MIDPSTTRSPLDAVESQTRVEHGLRIDAHAAGAGDG